MSQSKRTSTIQTHPLPLMLNCWQTGVLHGITHHAWISHSEYSSNANTHVTPLAEGRPLFWKRSVQIPCLVTPTCPGFHFSLPPLCFSRLFYFFSPVATFLSHIQPSCGVGTLHLWLSPEITQWCPRPLPKGPFVVSQKTLPESKQTNSLPHCSIRASAFCSNAGCLNPWHINIQFVFTMPPFLDLKTRISQSKSSNPLGHRLGRVLEIWLTEDSS